jgi:hypothetical protein
MESAEFHYQAADGNRTDEEHSVERFHTRGNDPDKNPYGVAQPDPDLERDESKGDMAEDVKGMVKSASYNLVNLN